MANQTIENWLRSAEGRPMDPDGAYGYQCVDLVDQYAQDIFGVRWQDSVGGVGGANELLDRVPDEYWWRVDNDQNNSNQIPQRGDVIVWAGDSTNRYGHVAVVLSADQNGVSVIQQNGNENWRPAHTSWLGFWQWGTGDVLGWLRPKEEKLLAPEAPSQCIVESGDTISGIAAQFYTTVERIKAANPGINIDLIHPGQVINL
jgi:surface antigen